MLEIFDQNPQSRVFHLDKECYVVYLGSHWEDYRPFLRIGTSTKLPDSLPPIVSTIVVPDVLTGNPLDEASCLAGNGTAETHYVGDMVTVEAVKAYVGKDEMPVGALIEADSEDDDGRHVLVYYYKDGNLKVKYRKSEVWDLRRREKTDGHFVGRAQEAKNTYGRGPFKLPGEVYQDPGFTVVKGVPYLVSRGEMAALELKPDYFFDLSAAGMDADRVTTVRVEEPTDALVRFFKRSRLRDRAVRVASPAGEAIGKLASLFKENTTPALQYKLLEGNGGAFTFQNYSITQATSRFEARLEGFDLPLVFTAGGKKGSDALVIDHKSSRFSAGSGFSGAVLDGCVYHVREKLPTRSDIEAEFLPEKNYPYRDLLSDAENNLLYQLGYYFNEVFAGRDPGKVLRTIKSLEPVKSIGRDDGRLHPVTEVLLHNYAQYALFVKQHEPQAAKVVDGILGLLKAHELKSDRVPVFMPLVGTIVLGRDENYLFYELAARITSDRYAHAPTVVERIYADPIVDHEAERARLADLISGLATPEQMDEARMRRITENQKKKEPPKQEPTAQDATQAKGSDAAPGAAGGFRGPATRAPKKKKSSNSWVLPVGIIAILIVALFGLLLTNVIPNPWFGEDTPAIAGNGDPSEQGNATAGDVGAGENGSPEDADDAETGSDPAGNVNEEGAADQADGETEGVEVPEGWPPESLPALRALDEMPDVTISDTGVTGPGGIEITIGDIIRLVNTIATTNGYDPMGADVVRSRDPDWIFPGSVFELPNDTSYTVERGDTLWDITVRYMVARLRQDYSRYLALRDEYEESSTSADRPGEIRSELRQIADDSHTENLSSMIRETLEEWE
ncbi:MAG: hypothetical protein ACLFP4_11815 [Spirochaetales bacterium]